jgi:hypothetical protein
MVPTQQQKFLTNSTLDGFVIFVVVVLFYFCCDYLKSRWERCPSWVD